MKVETSRSYGHQCDSRRITGAAVRWCSLILMAWLLPGLALGAANSLVDMSYSALPGNKVQFRLTLSAPLAEKPSSFATDTPARLVLDFPDVGVDLPRKTLPIGVGVAHSVSAVEAGNRTRVVFNLNEMVPYQMDVDENQVVLTLESGLAMAEQGSTPGTQSVLTQSEGDLRAIDFRRGPEGQGQVVIALAASDTVVDVREEGTKVILDILNTTLPDQLHQRLDVVDFATPVQTIESEPAGDNVQVSVLANGEYEYIAYQADNLYTLEFRPLTKQEQEEQQKQRHLYTGERLSLNFQDIEVRAVLQLLGDFTNLNMVVSDSVSGNITLRLKNVPWDQALDIILKTKGLSMRRTDNVIMVAPTAELLAQELMELSKTQEITQLAPLKTELIQINYAKAADIKKVLMERKQITTKISGAMGGGAQAASADEYVGMMSGRGMVTVDPRTNSLLITDTAQKLENIRRLILKLDVPVRQVLIESRIVIANNDFARDLGVRFGWSGSRSAGDTEVNISGGEDGYLEGTYNANKGPFFADVNGNPFNSGLALPNGSSAEALMVDLPAINSTSAVNFLIGKIGSYLLQLELSAMQMEGRGEVISTPRVVTSDQNQATIKAGTQIPYREASASGAATVSFKDAVLQLDVTPHITPDARIMMELKINKDSPDWERVSPGDPPPINTRSITTSVLVDNGETVVLGGIFERNNSSSKEQVPFFGDLPVLGHLFKRTSQKDENSELLIFITPKILKETLTAR